MSEATDESERLPSSVVELVGGLTRGGFTPVLVGGYALVLYGSREMTFDFDFVVASGSRPDDLKAVFRILYETGFRRISKLDEHGDVSEYVEGLAESEQHFLAHPPNVAFFWHPHDRIRVDILLDFPIPAAELIRLAEKIITASPRETILVASIEHLKELKRISYNYRRSPKDLRDLEFLENLPPKKGSDPPPPNGDSR